MLSPKPRECILCSGPLDKGVCLVCLEAAKQKLLAGNSPVLAARDVILEGLRIRVGLLLTDAIARERANNISMALADLLAPRGHVVSGEIAGAVPAQPHLSYVDDNDTAIGTGRPPATTEGG